MIDTRKLRCALGWLGMALPIIVLVLCLTYGHGIPDSISATYYLPTCITPFMIILGASGILLVCYDGYDKHDATVCLLAGLFAFGICLFPCGTKDLMLRWHEIAELTNVGTLQLAPAASGLIHNICAIGFFGLLAYNSYFLFTKTSGVMTANKKKRNVIFRVCGIGMAVSFLAIIPISILNIWGGVWLVETIALAFFGISWLTKANCYPWLFADKK